MGECRFCGEEATASHWCKKHKARPQKVECRFCRSIGDTESYRLEAVLLFWGMVEEDAWFCPECHATLQEGDF